MVGFALSCFGLLLFLWLAFGGPIPLKPKGYRFQVSFAEATQLAAEADVRISGVPVGKVKTIEPDKKTGRSIAGSRSSRATRRCPRTRKAILRQKTLLGETYVELTPGTPDAEADPRGRARWPTAQVSADRRARRDLPRVRPEDADGVPDLDADPGAGHRRLRARHQRRARQPRAVRRGHRDAGRDPQPPAGRGPAAGLQHRRGVRRAERARGPAAGADRATPTRCSRRPRRATASCRRSSSRCRRSSASRATTVRRLTEFAADTDPLVNQLRPAARELSPTLQDLAPARARPQGAVPRPRPADRRVPEGPPRRPARAPRRCGRSSASSTRRARSSTRSSTSSASTSAS